MLDVFLRWLIRKEIEKLRIRRIMIETTTYCNLRCAGCLRTQSAGWKNQHMSVEDYARIIDDLPAMEELMPQGVGEPTLHPDLLEMIKIARDSGKFQRISFVTNALAKEPSYYDALFDNGLTGLGVSVDSLDQEMASKLRAGTDVAKLKEALSYLVQHHPGKIVIGMVVGALNWLHVEETLSQLQEIGHFMVAMHPFDDMGDGRWCLNLDKKAFFYAGLSGLQRQFPCLNLVAEDFIPSLEVCHAPWEAPFINVRGGLDPCCRLRLSGFENVLERTFDAAFHSYLEEEWRERFRKWTPNCCLDCPFYQVRGKA
ncbi:MAG: radical SAM protein [Candidatus Omnitrophota bacterium]|jgi:MoaA/NifB/PqqE/SkfB family radical SAM enzyme